MRDQVSELHAFDPFVELLQGAGLMLRALPAHAQDGHHMAAYSGRAKGFSSPQDHRGAGLDLPPLPYVPSPLPPPGPLSPRAVNYNVWTPPTSGPVNRLAALTLTKPSRVEGEGNAEYGGSRIQRRWRGVHRNQGPYSRRLSLDAMAHTERADPNYDYGLREHVTSTEGCQPPSGIQPMGHRHFLCKYCNL